jgi:DNA-binding NarL/FixJ family response regulator
MDVRMPLMDGIEATRRIAATDSRSRVLILTTFDLDEYVYDAMRAGASGFLLKDAPRQQLVAGVEQVARGDALLAPTITRRLIERFTAATKSDHQASDPGRSRGCLPANCRFCNWSRAASPTPRSDASSMSPKRP